MDLRLLDGPLDNILKVLASIQTYSHKCNNIFEALGSNPLMFFRKLHCIFGRCWNTEEATTENCQVDALLSVLDFIHEILPLMTEDDVLLCLDPILSDMIRCLVIQQARKIVEVLFVDIIKCDEIVSKVHAECQNIILNTNDNNMIVAINGLFHILFPVQKIDSKSSQPKSRKFPTTTVIFQPENLLGEKPPNSSGNMPNFIVMGRSHILSTKSVNEQGNFLSSLKKSPRGSISSVISTPRILDISFLPRSICEQWLLSTHPNELSLIIDEVYDIYALMDANQRKRAKSDLPQFIKQIESSLCKESSNLTISCLSLLDFVFQDYSDEFIPELYILFPRLENCIMDFNIEVRKSALKLTYSMISRFRYNIVERFLLSVLDIDTNIENALKMSSIALLYACIHEKHDDLNTAIPTNSHAYSKHYTEGEDPEGAIQISQAAFIVKLFNLVIFQILPSQNYSLEGDEYEYHQLDNNYSTGTGSSTVQLAVDILAVLLNVLYPKEVNKSDLSHAYQSIFSNYLIGDISLSDSLSNLKQETRDEIFRRAQIVYFPALMNDQMLFPILDSAIRARHVPVHVSGLLPFHNENSLAIEISTKKSWSDNGDNADVDVKSTAADTGTPSDSPWHSSMPMTPVLILAPVVITFDHSKLSNLKKGRLRAHSAHGSKNEVSHELRSEVNERQLPNTSTGVRSNNVNIRDPFSEELLISSNRNSNSVRFEKLSINTDIPDIVLQSSIGIGEHIPTPTQPTGQVSRRASQAKTFGLRHRQRLAPNYNTVVSDDTEDSSINLTCSDAANICDQESLHSNAKNTKSVTNFHFNDIHSISPRFPVHNTATQEDIRNFAHVDHQEQITPSVVRKFSFSNVRSDSQDIFDVQNKQQQINLESQAPKYSSRTRMNRLDKRVHPNENIDDSQVLDDQPTTGTGTAIPLIHDHVMHETGAAKPEAFEYLSSDDIHPSANPVKELSKASIGLEKNEWPEIFQTLNSIRRIGLHHQQVLISSGTLHSIILGLMKQIDNLRSVVAKNAILALGDLFQGLGKLMDGEILTTIPNLVKRFGDSSGFLGESAEMALHQMIENVSSPRALAGLLVGIDHRTTAVRGKVSSLISYLLFLKADEIRGTKECDSIKLKLSKILSDQSPECRANAREIVRLLINRNLLSRSELEQQISPDVIQKALKEASGSFGSDMLGGINKVGVASSSGVNTGSKRNSTAQLKGSRLKSDSEDFNHDNITNQKSLEEEHEYNRRFKSSDEFEDMKKSLPQVNRPSKLTSVAKPEPRLLQINTAHGDAEGALDIHSILSVGKANSSTPSRAKVSAAKRMLESVEELQGLQALLIKVGDAPWMEKKQALTQLTSIIITYAYVLREAGKLESCVDNLFGRLEDGSVKVILHALTCIEKISYEAPAALLNSQFIVIPAMVSLVCSSNKQIATAGNVLLENIISLYPVYHVAQQLSTMATFEKDRVRSISFRLLSHGMKNYFGDGNEGMSPSGVVKKSIFPAILSTLSSATTKPDIRAAAIECLKSLYHAGGEFARDILLWIDDKKQLNEIKRILNV